MSEEVNLSEESNSQEEEVLDQDFLLEKVDEMRDLIHQQRFAECKPMLVAIFENCPNHKQYMRRLMHGLLTTVHFNIFSFHRNYVPLVMLGIFNH